MKSLPATEFQQLLSQGTVIEQDAYGPKVVRFDDGRYLKTFYHKSRVSSSHLYSRAQRFASNAEKLKSCDIATISMLDIFKISGANADAVIYQELPGKTVRQVLQENPQKKSFCQQLGSYIGQLHNKGIMFRSLHLGNIVQQPNGDLGLIDIADMRLNWLALNKWQRQRNFQHIFRYQLDKELVDLKAFIEGYLGQVKRSAGVKQFFAKAITEAKPQVTQ